MLMKMIIDEERIHVLTKYSTRCGVRKIVESDHNPMWCKFDMHWSSYLKPVNKVGFNFKDKESQEAFKKYNYNNDKLITHLNESSDIVSGGRKWFSELKDSIHKSFPKIRLKSQDKDKDLLQLYDRKMFLKKI